MPLSPSPFLQFVDGPAYADPDVLAWLERSQRAMLRVPVVVEFTDEYRLGVGRAWIGTTDADAGPDAIFLKLDDSQMGVALLEPLRQSCPPGRRCAVWVEGMWGAALSGLPALSDSGPKRHPLTVRRFGGVQVSAGTHVGIAK